MSNSLDRTLQEVLHQYGWNADSAKSIGNVWKVMCGEETYAIKRSKASKEKLLLLHRVLEKMSSKYIHLLPWIRTKEGSPVVTLEGVSWYATPWKENKGAKEVPKETLMKALASFHQLSESIMKPYSELQLSFTEDDLNDWKDSEERLIQYKKKVEAREFQSPFDKQFTRSEEMVTRVVDFAIRGLNRFLELEKGTPPRFTLCHKRFHPKHVVQDEKGFYFINFDHVQVESPIKDIAAAIRRLAEPGDEEHPIQLLETYESVHKLLPIEKKLLALHLAYPSRLLRSIDKYYKDANVSRNELTSLRRLEKEISQLEQFEELIKNLWNAKKPKTTPTNQKVPVGVSGKRKGKPVKA